LDSELNGGRPVLILKAKNIVEEHDKQVVVSYSFQKSRMIVEPLMLVGLYLTLFLLCSLLARAGAAKSVAIAPPKDSKKEQ
jgi:hypothetical protein